MLPPDEPHRFCLYSLYFLRKQKVPSQKKSEKGRKNPRYHPNSVIKLQRLTTYYHTLSF